MVLSTLDGEEIRALRRDRMISANTFSLNFRIYHRFHRMWTDIAECHLICHKLSVDRTDLVTSCMVLTYRLFCRLWQNIDRINSILKPRKRLE
jgi:hypothetical protein